MSHDPASPTDQATDLALLEEFDPTPKSREIFKQFALVICDCSIAAFFEAHETEREPRKAAAIVAHAMVRQAARIAVFAAMMENKEPSAELWTKLCRKAFDDALVAVKDVDMPKSALPEAPPIPSRWATANDIVMVWGVEQHPAMHPSRHNIAIPAGTRVIPCDDGTGEYLVDDLSWLNAKSIVHHDATHYGIRLKPEQVAPVRT